MTVTGIPSELRVFYPDDRRAASNPKAATTAVRFWAEWGPKAGILT
jgi:hypothetical protein